MRYNGYEVGPVIRQLRQDRNLTLEQVSAKTGLSVSSIKQLEQGGRNMSMNTLYLFMTAYNCDANTVLNISKKSAEEISIDSKLKLLPADKRNYFTESFLYMLLQAEKLRD